MKGKINKALDEAMRPTLEKLYDTGFAAGAESAFRHAAELVRDGIECPNAEIVAIMLEGLAETSKNM